MASHSRTGATLVVSDTAADLLANFAGAGKATTVTLTGTSNTVTAAQAASLTALKGFVLTTGATLAVNDTAAQLSASIDKLKSLAVAGQITSIAVTDSNPLTITYTQYSNDTAALGEITGGYSVAVSGAPVSAAPALQGAVAVTSFSVSDTAANVVAAVERAERRQQAVVDHRDRNRRRATPSTWPRCRRPSRSISPATRHRSVPA